MAQTRAPNRPQIQHPFVDPKTGIMTQSGLNTLDQMWKQVAAGFTIVPCTAEGTAAIVLTPTMHKEGGVVLGDFMAFAFVAVADSDGPITFAVGDLLPAPAFVSFGNIAANGAIVAGGFYIAYYASLFGGFILTSPSGNLGLPLSTTFNISPTGSDSGSGSVSDPLATIGEAITRASSVSWGSSTPIYQYLDGDYGGIDLILDEYSGAPAYRIQGNASDPTAVTGFDSIILSGRPTVSVSGLEVATGVSAYGYADVSLDAMSYTGTFIDVSANEYASVRISGGEIITNSKSSAHIFAVDHSQITYYPDIISLVGTPDFGNAFAIAYRGGLIDAFIANPSTGLGTGSKYRAQLNGTIEQILGEEFPGDAAGTTSSGGQYG